MVIILVESPDISSSKRYDAYEGSIKYVLEFVTQISSGILVILPISGVQTFKVRAPMHLYAQHHVPNLWSSHVQG